MLNRLALAVGGLAAAGVLALALGAGGFTFGPPATIAAADAVAPAAVAPAPQTQTVTDNVYVMPTPEPRVIHVNKPAVAGSHQQQVVTIVRRAPESESDGSEHDSEGSGGD
jgi:hypothetical protein